MTESSVLTSSFKSSTWICSSLMRAFVSFFFSVAVLMYSHPKKFLLHNELIPTTLNVYRAKNVKVDLMVEPPARIELATSSLPMRCYTTKPRWRRPCHQAFRYNRFASSKNRREDVNWRRERDLNSRGTGPRDFQSRALPGYAISARSSVQSSSGFNALACQCRNARTSKGDVHGVTWTVGSQQPMRHLTMHFHSIE